MNRRKFITQAGMGLITLPLIASRTLANKGNASMNNNEFVKTDEEWKKYSLQSSITFYVMKVQNQHTPVR